MNEIKKVNQEIVKPIVTEKKKLEDVSKAFESLLVQMMFKEMNKSLEQSFFGSGTGSHIYQALFESNMVDHFVSSKNFGMRDKVESYLNMKMPGKKGVYIDYSSYVNEASGKYNLPTELINAVIQTESNGNSAAISRKGAKGLMQLMDETAKSMGVENSFSPRQNILGGSKYLRHLLDKYDQNLEKALAAYNSGPGNVDKYNGIPPFNETKQYVSKILGMIDTGDHYED